MRIIKKPSLALMSVLLLLGVLFEVAAGVPASVPDKASSRGIWISLAEIAALPMEGPAWAAIKAMADKDFGTAYVANQDSRHDIDTYACALAAIRTGLQPYRDKAVAECMEAIGTDNNKDKDCPCTPNKARSLALGRNMLGYIVAADLLGLRADGNPNSNGSRFQAWIAGLKDKLNCSNTTCEADNWKTIGQTHDGSGSNASAQCGAVRVAMALYLGDTAELNRAWDTFRRYSGDTSVGPKDMVFNENGLTWSHDPNAPAAVNPKGATKNGHRIDGAIINDQGRGGAFTWPPGYTQYPWVGLEGYMAQAYMLYRAGYPALDCQDRAPLRAVDYQYFLYQDTGDKTWWNRTYWVQYLTNRLYGTKYPIMGPATGGNIMAWTDWTHGS